MQRSRSSSHLPVPISRSNNVRSSSLVRSASIEKLSLDPSKLHKRSMLTTPVAGPSRGRTTLRSNSKGLFSITPGSSTRKSPYKRPLNNPAWVSEQYGKVYNFLLDTAEFDENTIKVFTKPLTTNTFIKVMKCIMKQIDPETSNNLTLANYKEAVPTQLKLMDYPVPLTNSLFKTVNTTHSWPQVISMLSWLVDVIEEFNMEEEFDPKTEILLNYQRKLYQGFNNDMSDDEKTYIEAEFKLNIATLLDVDPSELESDKKKAHQNQTYLGSLKNELESNQNTAAQIAADNNQMKLEITDFAKQTAHKESDFNSKISQIELKVSDLIQLLTCKQAEEIELKAILSVQPISYKEKLQLINRIEVMKHSVTLKIDRIEKIKSTRDKFDFRLVQAKKKLRTEVYRLNNELIEPIVIFPQLKTLTFNESQHFEKTFHDEIVEIANKKATLLQDLRDQFIEINNANKKSQADVDKLAADLYSAEKNAKETKADDANAVTKLEEDVALALASTKIALQKKEKLMEIINDTVATTPNTSELEAGVEGLKVERQILWDALTDYSVKCIEFLQSVEKATIRKYENMTEIRESISEAIHAKMQSIITELSTIKALVADLKIVVEGDN